MEQNISTETFTLCWKYSDNALCFSLKKLNIQAHYGEWMFLWLSFRVCVEGAEGLDGLGSQRLCVTLVQTQSSTARVHYSDLRDAVQPDGERTAFELVPCRTVFRMGSVSPACYWRSEEGRFSSLLYFSFLKSTVSDECIYMRFISGLWFCTLFQVFWKLF